MNDRCLLLERCRKCGRSLAQVMSCGACYALANPRVIRMVPGRWYDRTTGEEQPGPEECNPGEGSKG